VIEDLKLQSFPEKAYLRRSTRNVEGELKNIYEEEKRQMSQYSTIVSKQPVYSDNFGKPSYLVKTNFISIKKQVSGA
jgi:hypothetical protein